MKKSNCSVLLCLYRGDNPKYFRESLESIFAQTMPPNEIVIIIDGEIGKALEQEVAKAQQHKEVKIVRLKKNGGVGHARNEGLENCNNELIAIMDSDDIMVPNRLELQMEEFQKDSDLVLLGGQLAEFKDNDIKNVVFWRKVPTKMEDIRKFARKRSPFNNQTVVYKKTAVLEIGGYSNVNRAEDYRMFAKLIMSGAKVKNLDVVLTYFRLDEAALARRKTWTHTKEIIEARNEIRKMGLCNWFDFLYSTMAQILIFVMPLWFTKFVYKRIRQ